MKKIIIYIFLLFTVFMIGNGRSYGKTKLPYMDKENISETIYLFEKWIMCEKYSEYKKTAEKLWGIHYETDELLQITQCKAKTEFDKDCISCLRWDHVYISCMKEESLVFTDFLFSKYGPLKNLDRKSAKIYIRDNYELGSIDKSEGAIGNITIVTIITDDKGNMIKINFIVFTHNGPNADYGLLSMSSTFDGKELNEYIDDYKNNYRGE
jgi:hypothetical protein